MRISCAGFRLAILVMWRCSGLVRISSKLLEPAERLTITEDTTDRAIGHVNINLLFRTLTYRLHGENVSERIGLLCLQSRFIPASARENKR